MNRTQPPPGVTFNKPLRADYSSMLRWRGACMSELRRAWKEYDKAHAH